MRTLDLKLFRSLWSVRGQMLAIWLVLAAGMSIFILAMSNYQTLSNARDDYYRRNRFGRVFAQLKHAPLGLESKIRALPGVASVGLRIVKEVSLDLEGMDESASALMISVPTPRRPMLNEPHLVEGRYPEPGLEEVLVSELFADANGIRAGDRVAAIMNGRRRHLKVAGIALSPEYIFLIKPGAALPDNKRFGVFWAGREVLAGAFNMEGAFNHVSLLLSGQANINEVMARLNELIEPYGGLDSIPRKDQISHWFLDSELKNLKNMAFAVPLMFFFVAVFLLNMVLSRMIRAQREQIGVLKALGYTDWEIGLLYLKLVVFVVVLGGAAGTLLGAKMGKRLSELYNDHYRFPALHYELDPAIVLGALVLCLGCALAGTYRTFRNAVQLAPAEAMLPEPPAEFKAALVERLHLNAFISPWTGMILRQLERRKFRAFVTVLGVALSLALVVLGRSTIDSMEVLLDFQFNQLQRQDLDVTFYERRPHRALHELASIPGVLRVEPSRSVPARLRHQNRARRIALIGLIQNPTLQRPLDRELNPIVPPKQGIALGRMLAETLGVRVGDMLRIEVLDGEKPKKQVPVASLIDEYIGSNAYMDFDALNRLMGEDRLLTAAYLKINDTYSASILQRLKHSPAVKSVTIKTASIESFEETLAESILIMTFINILFSAIIAFGVVFNTTQMMFTEQKRELATLRALGFTQLETAHLLLGELAFLIFAAIPCGCIIGYAMSWVIFLDFQTEFFRMPFFIETKTYAIATLVTLLSASISGLVVRQKLMALDIVEELKAKE